MFLILTFHCTTLTSYRYEIFFSFICFTCFIVIDSVTVSSNMSYENLFKNLIMIYA